MKLIVDSGSTKADWCLTDNGHIQSRFETQGINPMQQDEPTITAILSAELQPLSAVGGMVTDVYFYGAGCRDNMSEVMAGLLRRTFTHASTIEVHSDLLAAARSLCGHESGVACILGTGANSCLYDGERITANVPPLGYILGDEGSGAVLGRNLVNALYKGRMPERVATLFADETGLTMADVIARVYRQPMANRFLAGFSVFIKRHIDEHEELRGLVIDNFRAFFRNNVSRYNDIAQAADRPLTVNAIGSLAWCYSRELSAAAAIEGFKIGAIERSPMAGLTAYHG